MEGAKKRDRSMDGSHVAILICDIVCSAVGGSVLH